VEHWLRPYVVEPTLWPVTIVLLAHVVAVLAPLMLLAWRDGMAFAWVVVALSAGLCLAGVAAELVSTRRPGAAAAIVGVTWGASAALAWVADLYQLF
jgi:hypothetical protein